MRALILTVSLGFATISGCSFPGVYKLDVQQGNIVTQDMLDQLETGMTQRQVAFVMGTPVLNNPFAVQQWDYLYTFEHRDEIIRDYHIRVFFDDQNLFTHYTGELNDPTDKEGAQPKKKQEAEETAE